MKLKLNLAKTYTVAALAASIIAMYSACTPDDAGDGNGLDSPNLEASFTMTPFAGKTNTYALKANDNGVISVKWDKGTGVSYMGKTIDTVFLPDAGTYNIALTAVGKGGIQKTASKSIVVATSDPIAGNILVGGKFNPGDETKWTVTKNGTDASVQFLDGKAVFRAGSWNGAAISQPVQVIANKKYKLDMIISGGGAADSWFEVYMGQGVPVNNSDYNEGGKIMALSTWGGCGSTPYNGQFTTLACDGSRRNGILTFPTSGTYYLVIRGGSGNTMGPNGVSIDNVELRGTN